MMRFIHEWETKSDEVYQKYIGILLGISCILALFMLVYCIKNLDITPATTDDYIQLESQAEKIINGIRDNPGLLFEVNGKINCSDNGLFVHVQNEQCKLTNKYNDDFEIISSLKEDKCYNVGFAILTTIFLILVTIILVLCTSYLAVVIIVFFKQLRACIAK